MWRRLESGNIGTYAASWASSLLMSSKLFGRKEQVQERKIDRPSESESSARVVDDIIHVLALVLKCQGALTPLRGRPSFARSSSWQVIGDSNMQSE